jgi:hypothetical protein
MQLIFIHVNEDTNNYKQQFKFINNQLILNMFRPYLRPSSGGRAVFYCLLFPVIVVMMLESRVVRCVHCDGDVA